jgi:hypothetical protein
MTTRVLCSIFTGFTLLGSPLRASADVTAYSVARTVSDTQDSNAQPTDPEFWAFRALVICDVPNEIVSSSVSFNRPPVLSYDFGQSVPTLYEYSSPFYTSDPSFLLDYPAVTYTITADLGAGPETGDVVLPEDLYCEATPWFTGDTWDRLQAYDVTQAFTVEFNGFTPNPATNVAFIYLSVVEDLSESGAVISVSLNPSETSFEIPANTLIAGTGYSIGLTYLNVLETPNAGFGGNATSGAEFYRSSTAYFTTLPAVAPCCRGDFNNDNQFNTLDIQGFVDALLAGETCP